MIREERLKKLVEYIKEKKSATFNEIAEQFDIADSTARSDLKELEKKNVVKIVRGGAVWAKFDITRGVAGTRKIINKEEKRELVRNLGEILDNGYAVFINGGTTSVEAARYIADNYSTMTVITNSLDVIDIMKDNEDFLLILTSGIYDDREHTIVGSQAAADIALYNADVAIISVSSISIKKGITEFREEESRIVRAMVDNSRKKVVIADHSKFDRIDFMNVCGIEEIDVILTDSGTDNEVLERYIESGVEVLTC